MRSRWGRELSLPTAEQGPAAQPRLHHSPTPARRCGSSSPRLLLAPTFTPHTCQSLCPRPPRPATPALPSYSPPPFTTSRLYDLILSLSAPPPARPRLGALRTLSHRNVITCYIVLLHCQYHLSKVRDLIVFILNPNAWPRTRHRVHSLQLLRKGMMQIDSSFPLPRLASTNAECLKGVGILKCWALDLSVL